ncbi:MAG TPA: HAD family phosphatase [Propionibacteriaceae bacterium]|nr:HAD family phosphatase [Propionibacteriaceae bacterium]
MAEVAPVLAGRGVFDAVRVVLCDADGNLFPSEEPAFVASTEVTNEFLGLNGVPRRYDAEELRLATTGMNFRSTLVALALEHGIPVAPELAKASDPARPAPSSNASTLTPSDVDAWVAREKEAVTRYLRTVLHPDPAVLEPLAVLAESYELAAVSSSADSRIAACFEVTGMAEHFPAERRFSAEDSLPRPTSKPDPAIYLHAGKVLGIAAGEGLAVEDSVAGATSAVAAGFPTIGNLQFVQLPERDERRAALERAGVAAIVTSWSEVLTCVHPAG